MKQKIHFNETFMINVFKLFILNQHYNIDQSDPQFKSTAGTQQLIEEKFKKRNLSSRTKRKNDDNNNDIVTKLKRKSIKND